jgi:hypothetical protein
MKIIPVFIFHIFVLLSSGCYLDEQGQAKIPGYNLSSPDERITLPDALHEISGMTLMGPSSFACIEDEDGILFIYDFVRQEIISQTVFWGKGDYEGIARVNDTIYVLRSDGMIFEISDYKSEAPKVILIPTGIPRSNNEGLCYDEANRRLLITCKEYIGKFSKTRFKRIIFGLDLKSGQLLDKPVYKFDLKDIADFAEKQGDHFQIEPNKWKHKNYDFLRFHPSDIAINSTTGRIYILSAVDHTLGVFNTDGRIENFVVLNPALFNQAEGIIFLGNGDMLISNEGGNGRPTLLRFNYRKR